MAHLCFENQCNESITYASMEECNRQVGDQEGVYCVASGEVSVNVSVVEHEGVYNRGVQYESFPQSSFLSEGNACIVGASIDGDMLCEPQLTCALVKDGIGICKPVYPRLAELDSAILQADPSSQESLQKIDRNHYDKVRRKINDPFLFEQEMSSVIDVPTLSNLRTDGVRCVPSVKDWTDGPYKCS
jgi:hypothetical protein